MGRWIKCCKDCVAPKRHSGCHSICEEYIKEKAKHEELKAKMDANKKKYTQANDYECDCAERRAHRKHIKSG